MGCNAGNDLRLLAGRARAVGLDYNPAIARVAAARLGPAALVAAGAATRMPYGDSSVDMVFTHGFFNHLDDRGVEAGIDEVLRVAGRYAASCELLEAGGEDGRGRNMYEAWSRRRVKIISNVEMHGDIDPARPRFLLVKKIRDAAAAPRPRDPGPRAGRG